MPDQMHLGGDVERPADFRARMLQAYMPRTAVRPGPTPVYSITEERDGGAKGWHVAQVAESFYSDLHDEPVFAASDLVSRVSYALYWVKHNVWGWRLVVLEHIGWQASGGILRYCPTVLPHRQPVRMAQLVYECGEAWKDLDAQARDRIQTSMQELGKEWIRRASSGARPDTDGARPAAGQRWK